MIGYFTGVLPGTTSEHYCRTDGYQQVPNDWPLSPWGGLMHLLDWHPKRDGLRTPRDQPWRRPVPLKQLEGEFVHLLLDGWTLIAAWDRSADNRGGCTASFAFQAELTGEKALSEARRRWPEVIDRIEAHVGRPVTVRPYGSTEGSH